MCSYEQKSKMVMAVQSVTEEDVHFSQKLEMSIPFVLATAKSSSLGVLVLLSGQYVPTAPAVAWNELLAFLLQRLKHSIVSIDTNGE